jgi:hypothetical protein
MVNWDFLQQVLRMKGFTSVWCQWMERVVSKGSVCVQVNQVLRMKGFPSVWCQWMERVCMCASE